MNTQRIRHPYRALRGRFGKSAALAIIVGLVVVSSAAAFIVVAYLGASGSGTQMNAATGGQNQNQTAVTITATWPAGLVDGGSEPLTFSGTDNNPSSSYHLTNVAVSSITFDAAHTTAGCLASWFVVTLAPSDLNPTAHFISTTTPTPFGGVGGSTIAWVDSQTVQQWSCQGATVTVNLTATATAG